MLFIDWPISKEITLYQGPNYLKDKNYGYISLFSNVTAAFDEQVKWT